MKRIFSVVVLVTVLTLFGCSGDDMNTTVIGKWKLVQVLVDPGDGSGVFSDIESDKPLLFLVTARLFLMKICAICLILQEMEAPGLSLKVGY